MTVTLLAGMPWNFLMPVFLAGVAAGLYNAARTQRNDD